MKKGLIILIGIFSFIFMLNSFVSANYCLGNIDCASLSKSNCDSFTSAGYCRWEYSSTGGTGNIQMSYQGAAPSISGLVADEPIVTDCIYNSDCVSGVCNGGICGCTSDDQCPNGKTCYNNYCMGGACVDGSNNANSCSHFDHTSSGYCSSYGCTWQPGCLLDSECSSQAKICVGAKNTCSGFYTSTTKVDWQGADYNAYANWAEGGNYYTCINVDMPTQFCNWCLGCNDINNEGYGIRDSTWVHTYCNGDYNWFGLHCYAAHWDSGATIRSGYASKNCNAFLTNSACTPSGCTWIPSGYGSCQIDQSLDQTPRVAFWSGKVNQHTLNGVWRTDPDGSDGSYYYNDHDTGRLEYCRQFYADTNCVKPYKIETITTWRLGGNVGGPFTSTQQSYECVQDSSKCPNCEGKICGTDGVGGSCGDCVTQFGQGYECSAEGTCYLPCTAETDSAFCTRLEKTCGSVTDSDNCGTLRTVNCGTSCPTGQECNSVGQCVTPTVTPPTPTYWVINGQQVNNGGNLAYYIPVTMWVDNNLGLTYGTPVTFYIYKEGSDTPLATVSGSVDYTRIGSTWYYVSQAFLDSLDAGGSKIYFNMTGGGKSATSLPSINVIPKMCELTSASWSTIGPVVAGTPVRLNLVGTNCGSKTITFEVWEYDSLLGVEVGSDFTTIYPSSIVYGSPNTYLTWTSEWQADNFPETDPPEYYFKAITDTSSIVSSTVYADMLKVEQTLLTCGDGIISNPNSAGFNEECDGSASGAASCASHYSSESGWTGTPNCNPDCTLNYNSPPCIAPLVCSVTSASWSKTEIVYGKSVKLNVQTSNCIEGDSISFIIKEDNHGALFNPDRTSKNTPANAFITSNSATGTWTAEWIDDTLGGETNPPEYYFTATIVKNGRSLTSTKSIKDELNVTQTLDVMCSSISSCSNYLTQSNCEKDLCTVGENEVPSTVTCGGRFNSNTGCFDSTNCGCSWISGVCKPSWTSTSSCGTCGNYIRDFGEECDDGNLINGDGCSSTCKFESYIDPCPIGLTLCSDGTCSLNCEVTDTTVAACDYDHSCETGEGCTCSDCNGYIDTCEADLTCNIFDKACCNPSSDGICSPYCAYVDPDCLTGTCGNGVEEKGEECDLGIRNSNTIESGCNSDCTLQDNIIPGLDGCPEGTNLCSDGTCSLNCFATDEGITGCNIPGTCAEGLVCSVIDQACCNEASDGYCDEYCSFVDPDCVSTGTGENVVGTCSYTEIGTDTCEDDHMLTRHLAHAWTWAVDNLLYSDPLGKEAECVDIEDTLVCPASVEVPFFGIYEFAIAVVVIGLIYLIYELRKKNNSKKKKRK